MVHLRPALLQVRKTASKSDGEDLRSVYGSRRRNDTLNRAIEIHDSILETIEVEGDVALLRFEVVYIHESEGRPGWDDGVCWMQAANIVIDKAVVEGGFSEPSTWLRDGFVKIDDVHFDLIPVPLDAAGNVELVLDAWVEEITIRGKQIRLELIGEPDLLPPRLRLRPDEGSSFE